MKNEKINKKFCDTKNVFTFSRIFALMLYLRIMTIR